MNEPSLLDWTISVLAVLFVMLCSVMSLASLRKSATAPTPSMRLGSGTRPASTLACANSFQPCTQAAYGSPLAGPEECGIARLMDYCSISIEEPSRSPRLKSTTAFERISSWCSYISPSFDHALVLPGRFAVSKSAGGMILPSPCQFQSACMLTSAVAERTSSLSI